MEFNFIEDEEEEEFLDLSDLYEEEEDQELEVSGHVFTFEEEVPKAMSLTDPEVKNRARRGRKKKGGKKDPLLVGFKKPYVHGLCKEGVAMDAVTILPATHGVCQKFEEWNARAGNPCACPECDHPQTLEEWINAKEARKKALLSSR